MKTNSNCKAYKYFKIPLVVIGVLLFLFTISSALAQSVVIPRDGFPYCEPFTGSTTRANTVFDGVPNTAILTANAGIDGEGDGFLRLTNADRDQRGYVFIDLPFSSAYGIKVSFEYFAYGGIDPAAAADGISFFMFDGDIGPNDGIPPSNPSEFRIGGLGGSLGYSPWRSNNGSILQPGLRGAYIGIGFDAFRNWGNEYEGRFGGFKDASATGFGPVPDERQYYNTIAVRGPESTNYQFIDGKRTFDRSFLNEQQPAVYTDPINSSYYLFDALDPVDYFARRFKIGSANRAELCGQDGYRKVFIDLFPTGGGNYLLSVHMLVNNGGTLRVEPIFENLPYNFPAPDNLKIGFAASTGGTATNFHEIRNVTAQVSDYASIPIPEIQILEAEVCQDEENLFEFDVSLTSDNSFVRCVQLFENDPGAPDNTAPTTGDPSLANCGISGVCVDKCDPNNNSITLPGKGTFNVILEELTSGNFDTERFKASVNFVPEPGFTGEASIYYQVLDNYGLLSEPKTITVQANPYPAKLQDPSFDYPTCSGQPDGSLSDLIIENLVSGFDYDWSLNGTSIGKTDASVSALVGGEATFELNNISIGTYTLSVWNPSDNGICERSFSFLIDQETGTPVDLDLPSQIICEGDDATLSPSIDPSFGSDAGAQFFWYLSADRAGGAIVSGSTITIDGQPVTVSIQSGRDITLSGLVSNGNSPKTYSFYVEAQPTSNPSGNFCPYQGDVLTVGNVEVYPPLDFSATKDADDWCLDNSGSITASVSNPTSSITYELLDDGGNVLTTQIDNGSFGGLGPGIYEVTATSSNPQCLTSSGAITIEGPSIPLTLNVGSSENAFCNDANGSLSFTLLGGNPGYSISLNGNTISGLTPVGNVYTIDNLAANSYSIAVTDAQGCSTSINMVVDGDPISEFAVSNDEICEGEIAVVSPQIVNQSTSTPTFNWFYEDPSNPGNYIAINTGDIVAGVTYTIDGSDNLSVDGLAPQATIYTYYLEVTGPRVCPQGYIPATILVIAGPEIAAPIVQDISCAGLSDGRIEAQMATGNLIDFEYNLVGDNGFDSGFLSNSGVFTGLSQGTYELFVRGAGSCTSLLSGISIVEPTPIVATEISSVDATCAEPNGELRFTVSGGTPDGSGEYAINVNGNALSSFGSDLTVNGTNDFTLTNLAPATYSISITDSNGCLSSLSIEVLDTPVPQYDVDDITLCENELAVLTPIEVSNSIGASPIYSWFYEDPSNVGNYISINNGDVVGGVTYTIDGSDNLSVDGLAPQATPYTYYLEVTGSQICPQGFIPATILVIAGPEIAAPIVQDISCSGLSDGRIEVQMATGNLSDFEYNLVGDNGFDSGFLSNSGVFTGLAQGTYELFVRGAGSCTSLLSGISIVEPTPIVATEISSVDATCAEPNGELRFTVSGGTPDGSGEYAINVNGNALSSFGSDLTVNGTNDFTLTNLAPATYSISITDSNGCLSSLSIEVLDTPVPQYDVDDITLCENELAVLTPIEVSNSIGASPIYSWFYEDPSNVGNYISINNGDVVGGVTYTIDGSDNLSVDGLAPQATPYTYYLEVTGSQICPQGFIPATILVIAGPEIAAPIVQDISCSGLSDGRIEAQMATGNLSDFEYNLVGDNGFDSGFLSNSGVFTGLAQGTYELFVRVGGSCTSLLSGISILEPTIIVATEVSKVNPSCTLDNGSVEFLIEGGNPLSGGEYDILIDGLPLTDFNATSTVLGSGEYEIQVSDLPGGVYTLEVLDANGCSVSTSFELIAQVLPEYGLTDIGICANEEAIILVNIVNPGTPDANPVFRWFNDAAGTQEIVDGPDTNLQVTFEVDNVSGQLRVFDIQNPGTYTFYLKPDIINSCDLTAVEVNLNVNAIPEVTFEAEAASCFGIADGEIRAISGTDPTYTYSLNTGESNNTGIFTGLAASDYQITITDGIGCVSVVDITVSEPDLLEINALDSVDPTCGDTNGEIQFEISGGTPIYAITINGNSIDSYSYQENGNVFRVQQLGPGTYSVDVSDDNSCVASANNLFTLVNNDGIDIVSLPMNDEICESGIVQLIPNLTIPSGASPILRWYLDAAASQEIISDSNPAADGNIYEISANSSLSIQNLSPGTYTYYLRITGSGICTQVTEATVVVDAPLSATVEQTQISCFGGNGGEIRLISPTGGDGIYEYSIDGSAWQSSAIFSDLVAGSYQVRMRDSSGNEGCGFEATVNIEQPDNPISINTPDVLRSSCGLDNGAIRNLVVSGGWGGFNFEWRKDDPISGALLTQGTLTGIEDLAPGDYYLIVIDLEGCTEQFDFEIEASSDPVYALVDPIDVCFGQSIPIRPIHLAPDPSLPPASETEVRWYSEPGQSGLISTGSDVNDPTIFYTIDDSDWLNPELVIENLPVGVHDFYFYVVCTGQEIQVDIEVFATPDVVFETDPVSCFGDTDGKIRAVSGANSSYLYSLDGGSTISLQDIENMNFAFGTYNIEVITPAGCPQTISLDVESPSAPLTLDELSQFDPGCGAANGRVIGEISGGWAPYRIEIYQSGTLLRDLSTSGPEFEFDGLVLGDYSLEIIDNEGCRISSPTLTLIDGPTQILVDDQEICFGQSVTLSPTLDPQVAVATYFWSFDPAGTNIIQSSPNPASDGNIYQINSNGELTISGLPSSAQPYIYYVTAQGPDVCLGFLAEPTVTVLDAPTATITTVSEVCFGDGGSISVNASGGDGSYEYSIDGVNFQSSNTFDVPAGTYEVFVISGNGCLFSESNITVVGPSEPINISNLEGRNSSCNLANGQISFSVNGGYGDYSVDIFLDGINIGSAQTDANGDIVIGDLSIGEYSFEIRDSSGCLYVFDNPLELVEEPTQILIDDVSICEGESAILSPDVNSNSPNLTFSWYFDEEGNNPISSGTNGGVSYTISSNGEMTLEGLTADQSDYSYYVLAEGIGICGLEPVRATVSVEGIPELRVSNPSIVCNPAGTVDLTDYIEGFNPSVYDYNVLNPAGSSMLLDELSDVAVSGDYRVSSALKGSSCYNEPQRIRVLIAETELIANFEYEADLGGGFLIPNAEIQIQEDVNFQDLSQGDVLIWDWNFGDGSSSSNQNPIHQYQEKGTYTVRLTTIDSIGCISTYEVVVEVLDDYVVMIPNAFTPTGTKNMTFRPYYRGIASMEFYIFNTWGELIYETNSMEDPGWDGTLNGKDAPNGNYVFRGRFVSRSGETVNKSGVFVLIR